MPTRRWELDVLLNGEASPLSSRTRSVRVSDGAGSEDDGASWTLTAPAGAALVLPALEAEVEVRARDRGGPPARLGGRLRTVALSGDTRAGTVEVSCAGVDAVSALREKRDASYEGLDLGGIATRIADRAGLAPAVSPALAGIEVAQPVQRDRTDREFLADLAGRSGGRVAVKDGRLLVLPAGEAVSASGTAAPPVEVDVDADGAWLTWRRAAKDAAKRVTAAWLDEDGSTRRVASAGEGPARPAPPRRTPTPTPGPCSAR